MAIRIPDPILRQFHQNSTVWDRLKIFYASQFTSSGRTLVRIIRLNTLAQDWENNKLNLIQILQEGTYQNRKFLLRKIFLAFTPNQLSNFIETIIQKIPTQNFQTLNRCLELVTIQELQKAIELKHPSLVWGSETADIQCMAIAHKLLHPPSNFLPVRSSNGCVQFVKRILHTFIVSLSFVLYIKEPGSSWEASHVVDVFARFIALPFLIMTLINSLIGIPILSFIVTISLICIAASLIHVYLKRRGCPDYIPFCENLTLEAQRGKLTPVIAREDEINQVIQCLASSTCHSTVHPIIVGPTGAGKTEIFKGIALRIAEGRVPPQLLGKKLFIVNTAELLGNVSQVDSQSNLYKLMLRIHKYRDQAILVLDEVQTAFTKQFQLWQLLKTVLDSLPYCAAISTLDDYNKHFTDPTSDKAFAGRFVKIDVAPTNQNQTLLVLRDLLNRIAPEFHFSNEKLKDIEQSKGIRANPANAMQQLTQIIAKLREAHHPKGSVTSNSNLLLVASEYANAIGTGDCELLRNQLQQMLQAQQPMMTSHAINLVKSQQMGRALVQCRQELLSLSNKIINLPHSPSNIEWKKRWLAIQFIAFPFLKPHLIDVS